MKRFFSLVIAAVAVVSIMAAASPGAAAPRPAVVSSGACSGASQWRLTLKRDNARIEADVEVQTPAAGQQWRSRFADNGVVFGRALRTTVADGSFSATRFAANRTGPDLIRVRSLNLITGEVCRSSGTF